MSEFTRNVLVAFVASVVIGLALFGAVFFVGSRRDADASLSWGEAMAAATFAFFVMFWFYGVIPHQWLTWADNELAWRTDKVFAGPGGVLQSNAAGGNSPVVLSYQVARDIIAVLIYVVGLGMQIYVWAWWNDRKKPKEAVVPSSRYGRPLVKS